MATIAFDIVIRRICNGSDYSMRLFAKDADQAIARGKDRARFAAGIRSSKLVELERQGIAVFRVVTCTVSPNQSRPVIG